MINYRAVLSGILILLLCFFSAKWKVYAILFCRQWSVSYSPAAFLFIVWLVLVDMSP